MKDGLLGEGQAKVALRTCGRLHFTYGAVTLHFDQQEFMMFAESVRRLSAMVGQAPHGVGSGPRVTSNTHLCH